MKSLFIFIAVLVAYIMGYLTLMYSMSRTAEAAEHSIVFGGWSSHLGDSTYDEDGETHNSFGYGCNDWYVVVSEASYSNTTVAAHYDHKCGNIGIFTASIRLGAVWGYGDTPMGMEIAPLLLLALTYELYNDLYLQTGIILYTTNPVATANLLYQF